jgi:hypothetical protein
MNVEQLPEDSADLTDEEIDGAIRTASLGELRAALIHLSCGSCAGGVPRPVKHYLRRRKPNLYWRIDLKCQNGHGITKTFRADWLEPHGKQ